MDHSRWRTMTMWWLGMLFERSDAEVFSRRPRAYRTSGGSRGNHLRRLALVNALYDLAAPPHPGGQAIWGVFPKRRPDLPPLGAEIGAAVADCLAVLAYGLRIEFDQESVHLLLGGSHALANASIDNYQWRGFTELMQLAAFSDLITPHSDDIPDWDRLVRHLAYWACRGAIILLAHCLSIDTAYTGRSYKNYVHIRTFRAVDRSEQSLVAWFRDLPVLRFPLAKSSSRGATHPRSRRRRILPLPCDHRALHRHHAHQPPRRRNGLCCPPAIFQRRRRGGSPEGPVLRGPNCRGALPCLLPGPEKRSPRDRPGHRLRAPVPVDTLESIDLGGGSCSPTSFLLRGAKQGVRRPAPHPGILRPLRRRYTRVIGERSFLPTGERAARCLLLHPLPPFAHECDCRVRN